MRKSREEYNAKMLEDLEIIQYVVMKLAADSDDATPGELLVAAQTLEQIQQIRNSMPC